MLIIIILAVTAVLLYLITKINRFDYWEKHNIPTASGCEWFFGHLRPVFFVKKHLVALHHETYKAFPEAPAVGIYMMRTPALIVRDLELIKSVLISEFNHFSNNGFAVEKMSECLVAWNPFFLKEDEWRIARSHATPALSTNKLKGYLPKIFKVGDEMVKFIKRNCVDSIAEIDTKDISTMFTADVMGNAICGVESNTFEDKESLFATITQEVSRGLETNVMKNIKSILFEAFPILNRFFEEVRFTSKKSEELLLSLTRKIIRERTLTGEKRNDVYQVMMAFRENDKEERFTDEYITCQVFTIMLDLYETSSNALLVTLVTLSCHLEIQQKLRLEILSWKKRCNGEYSIEDIENFTYLDMVLNESLRLYSPLAVLSRECTSDCVLTGPSLPNPVKITKGTPVYISVTGLHSDPKYYPEPEKFDPDRFKDEEVAKRPKFTFLPFGDGPKKCLGMRIATLQVKVALIKILDNFLVRSCSKTKYPLDIDPAFLILTRPSSGTSVYFEKVKSTL